MTHTLRGFLRLTVCCMLGAMTLSGSLAAAGDAPRTPEDVQARMQELRRQYAPYLQSLPKPADPRQRTLLENGWRTKFEIEKATSSERPEPPEWFREDFDDSAWEPATVPEFRYAAAAYRQPQSSILWYRTRFSAGATPPGQRTFIVFAGVDWEAEVWLNGQSLGRHKVYYEPFRFDVTKLLKEKNVLAVRVFGGPRFGEPIAYWTVLPDPVADIQRYVRDPAKSIIGYKTDAQHLGAGFGIHREVFLETAGETIV